jgi:hypothetical protein
LGKADKRHEAVLGVDFLRNIYVAPLTASYVLDLYQTIVSVFQSYFAYFIIVIVIICKNKLYENSTIDYVKT